ncbi:MAG TPA: hypothetical protein VF618_17715 [Thermoanaerobaculia bacterium]
MRDFLAQYMPPNYSAHGDELDRLSANVHWLMLILFIGWGALFVFMLIRFNAKRHPKAIYHGTKSHLSTYAEVGVFVVEVVLLVGFSIPLWARWTRTPEPSQNPLEIRVVGEQFAWNVHYPGPDKIFGKSDIKLVSSANPLGLDTNDPNAKDDIVTLNQLHLEVNRATIIRLTSKDVIHSFSLPYMRVKQDTIPGMDVPVHFQPTRVKPAGEVWEIACAQLCGLGHYRMKGMYFVHDKAGMDKFLRETAPYATTSG